MNSQHKCKYCEREAVYDLDTHEGVVHLCENCDEDFTLCHMCRKAVLVEDARFLNDVDDRKTCYECVPPDLDDDEHS